MLTEWLRDHGSEEPAAYVMELLEDRGLDAETMLDLVAQGNLQAGGGRVALDFLAAQLPAGEIGPVLLGLAGDAAQPGSWRSSTSATCRSPTGFPPPPTLTSPNPRRRSR